MVIGISQYREEVIPKVPYAVQDAQAMASLLEVQGGIPKTHIRVLTDSKATSADLRTIGEWFRMRAKADSTLYVYYAGHGTPNPKTGEAFLVPWDGHPDYPSGLYSLKDLYGTLNSLPAKNVLVMLDSCFSGAVGRSVLAKGAGPMVISVENPMLAGGKVIVLAAATGNQISSDYDKASHGLFTNALLAGLQGEADANHDGIVTLQEVFPYVRQHVAETAVEELNREQTPVLLPAEDTLGQRMATPLANAGYSIGSNEIQNTVWNTHDTYMKTLNDKKAIGMNAIEARAIGTFVDDDYRSSVPPLMHEMAFMFRDQGMATRVAEGFERAVKLCGGKG